jgi:hypothetical protein
MLIKTASNCVTHKRRFKKQNASTGCTEQGEQFAGKGKGMIKTNLSKRINVTIILGISLSIMMVSCSTKDIAARQLSLSSDASLNSLRPEASKESTYVDGVHTATSNNGSRDSSIAVSITLVDDVITDIQITPHTTDPTFLDLQQRFSDAIPAVVEGKRIDEVNIDRMAVSGLTPDGFVAAIEQIKEQNRIGPTMRRK